MYHYDPATALEELREDAALPNPVHVRDMILRARLEPAEALDLNRKFVNYQKTYGEMLALGADILDELNRAPRKASGATGADTRAAR